ncbi:helix-turn-helix domain-containing protein [Paenibacillus sp. NPDC058071]|uniref:helix-turn-helix domain-containing protein n=1 Tax=Paenibacillus sp. NPDC058071 TaxID=3346326 RepID=UPI0036DF9CD0
METLELLRAERRTYEVESVTHTHDYAQFIIPLEGEMSMQTSSERLKLTADTLFLVPPHCEHLFFANGPNAFIVLDIPSRLLPAASFGEKEGGFTYPLTGEWRGIRYLLHSELTKSDGGDGIRSLFPYISRQLAGTSRLPASIRYIHEHYAEPLTVQRLADIEHYNRSHYSDWFRKTTGRSPSVYIQELRVRQAKELLRETDWPILQIALHVGLEHQASLTRLFHRFEGMTPRQYRDASRYKL